MSSTRSSTSGTTDGRDRLLILHNDHAENFELAQAPLSDPAAWTPVVPHRAGTRLLGVDAFAGHLVIHLRQDGLTGLRVLRGDGSEHEIDFPEPVYRVSPGSEPRVRRPGTSGWITAR